MVRTDTRFDRRSFVKGVGVASLGSLAGCSNPLGGGGGPVTIGFLSPTGNDIGTGGQRGAELAVEAINEEGGIMDRDVELVTGDSAFQASEAVSLINRFVEQDGADVIMGIYASEAFLGVMDRLSNIGIPFLCTGAATPEATKERIASDYESYRNIFRPCPVNSDFQADAMAEYAGFLSDEHGWNSFAVTVEDAAWSHPVTNRTPAGIREQGLEVAMNTRFSRNPEDWTPILDNVADSGADVMLKGIGHTPGTGLLSAWGASEYPFAQEGANISSMSPQYWSDTNGNCEYETTGGASSGVAPVTDQTADMVDSYTNAYSSRPALPMYMGTGSYDAVHLYKEAVEAAGTTDYENNLDDIVDELEGISYTGVSGTIEFHGQDSTYPHDVIWADDGLPFTINQWQAADDGGLAGTGGKKETVWPEAHATGDHQVAPWIE